MNRKLVSMALLLVMGTTVQASALTIPVYKTARSGQGDFMGKIMAKSTQYGVLLKPHLKGLKPGVHGFHVHQKPDCGHYAKASGGHWDPKETGQHRGPYNSKGHLGDLPALYVNQKGEATLPVLAPRIKVDDLKGHAIIIHRHGDNYADKPKPLGGGGARVACGIAQ